MTQPIESWSTDHKVQFLLAEDGKLRLNEQRDKKPARTTTLTPDQALDLLQFLWRVEADIFERMPEPEPNQAQRWHEWRKEAGFE